MIRLIKLSFIIFLITFPVKAQNVFDESNTAKFAGYLFQTQQFSLAAQEYERLVFMAPSSNDYKLSLISSYRLTGDYSLAKKRFSDLFGDSLYNVNCALAKEYLKNTLLQEDLYSSQYYLNHCTKLDENTRMDYQVYIFLLGKNWVKADSAIKKMNMPDPRVGMLMQEARNIKYKSPFLAGTFSAIVPGTGKVYTGYWKDGLVSFLFVAANAWQTYRGFSKNGVRSTQGWIFGGLTAGFYLGNIYGAVKAAKKHNKKANDAIYNKAKSVIYSGF